MILSTYKTFHQKCLFGILILVFLLATTLFAFITVPLPQLAHAASFNDAANGDWDSGATWGNGGDDVEGSGYPGIADTVVIDSHEVTMTANHSAGTFTLSGGTLTMGSNTLTVTSTFTESSGTFNEDTGTLTLIGSGANFGVNSSLTLNNLTINKNNDADVELGSFDTFVVNGTLTLTNGEFDGTGTINAKGPISIAAGFDGAQDRDPVILIDGASSQSFTIPDGASLPAINLNQSDTTIDFDADADVTIDGDFTLQAGTFTSTSGTLTFGAGLDTSAGGTFTHNSGTVVFTGNTATVDVNSSLNFNNLTVNKNDGEDVDITANDTLVVNGTMTFTDGDIDGVGTPIDAKGDVVIATTADGGSASWTISGTGAQTFTGSSGLPSNTGLVSFSNTGVASLGANTTFGLITIAAGGTLDLAGYNLTRTISFTNSGTLQLEGGETVNEPDTHSASSTVEYNDTSSAQTIKTWTYTNLKINAAGQTVSMGTDETLGEGLTVKAGTFDVADNALSINATTTINGGTMKTGTGVVTFGDNSSDVVRITSGTLEIESDDTTNDIIKTAGTWTNSGGTIAYTGSSVTTNLLSSLSPYYALTINDGGNASTYTLDGAINASSTLTITGGTLDANGQTILLDGNWVNNDAFTHGSGLVSFIGTSQSLTGATTFYDFIKSVTSADTLTFPAGVTQTIAGTLTLQGSPTARLTLSSDTSGTAWKIDPQGSKTISALNVKDSNNTNTTAISCTSDCSDLGNNTNWTFTAAVVAASNGVAVLPPNFGQIVSPLVAIQSPANKTKTRLEILLITKTLSLGVESTEVLLLQKFLNTNGFILTDIGLGSPGNETSYFGVLTQSAVQRYQCANSIVCTGTPATTGFGVVGPATRNSLTSEAYEEKTAIPTQTPTLSLSRNLSLGMEGEDIRELQQFLNQNNFTLIASGIGSPGNESPYYGLLTHHAVQLYQCAKNIVCLGTPFTTGFGVVGPRTRGELRKN